MPSRRSPPAVVWFDMDDTLFDHTFAARRGLESIWRDDARLHRVRFGALVTRYAELLDAISPSVSAKPITHAEARQERFRRLYESLGSPLRDREAAALSARYRAVYQRSRRAVPGAVALLRWLRPRAPVGIVTNNHTIEQEEKLAAIGIRSDIRFLVTSEEVGASKPDAAIFRHALERAGVGAEDSVMIGDRWSTDIVGARNAGIRAVWLNRWGEPRPADAARVDEIASFRPLFRVAPLLGNAPPSTPKIRSRPL